MWFSYFLSELVLIFVKWGCPSVTPSRLRTLCLELIYLSSSNSSFGQTLKRASFSRPQLPYIFQGSLLSPDLLSSWWICLIHWLYFWGRWRDLKAWKCYFLIYELSIEPSSVGFLRRGCRRLPAPSIRCWSCSFVFDSYRSFLSSLVPSQLWCS